MTSWTAYSRVLQCAVHVHRWTPVDLCFFFFLVFVCETREGWETCFLHLLEWPDNDTAVCNVDGEQLRFLNEVHEMPVAIIFDDT